MAYEDGKSSFLRSSLQSPCSIEKLEMQRSWLEIRPVLHWERLRRYLESLAIGGVRCWEREERGENLDRKGEGKWAVTSVRGTTNELISKK